MPNRVLPDGTVLIPVDLRDTTGNPSVLRVNAGYVATGQTAKVYSGKVTIPAGTVSTSGTATVTLETVTAGKTYVITDIMVTAAYQAAGAITTSFQIVAQVQAAGIAVFQGAFKGDVTPLVMQGLETQPIGTAGQVVSLVVVSAAFNNAAADVYYYIAGVEQ